MSGLVSIDDHQLLMSWGHRTSGRKCWRFHLTIISVAMVSKHGYVNFHARLDLIKTQGVVSPFQPYALLHRR